MALARRVLPVAFAMVMVIGFGNLVVRQFIDAKARADRIVVPTAPHDPRAADAPVAGLPAFPVPAARRITTTINTIAQLRRALPAGTIIRVGHSWRVERSVAVARHGVVSLSDVSLLLAPTSFLEAESGGVLSIAGSVVSGIRSSGRAPEVALPRRGFLLSAGGRLVLRNDHLVDLGHFADGAAGITFRAAEPGSEITGSTIVNAYGAIRVMRSHGVVIAGNRVIASDTDAVQITAGSDVRIADNLVDTAQGRGIVVSAMSHDVAVARNTVRCAGQYGVVVNDRSPRVTVTRNHIDGCLDGIAVTDSSDDTIADNIVVGSRRFGVRLTDAAASSVSDNTIRRSLVAVYAYAHSDDDQLHGNHFDGDTLDVRVRQDTHGVVVRPLPASSVIGR